MPWDKGKRKLTLPQARQPPSEWESKRLPGPLQRKHVKALANGPGHVPARAAISTTCLKQGIQEPKRLGQRAAGQQVGDSPDVS